MFQTIRERPVERRLLLSILFAGGYPSDAGGDSLSHTSLSLRHLDYDSRNSLAYLKKQRWVKEETDETGDKHLRLTSSGFSETVPAAKAILKTRFFLGHSPIPKGAADLSTQAEIASALLLFIYFSELTSLDETSGFLGIANEEWADAAVHELSSLKLIKKMDSPRFQEDWYKITTRGRGICENWLSGNVGAEWPFRALPLANRRHRSGARISPVTSMEVREIGSAQLEKLAFEYAIRELKLQNPRHVGGSGDGGADVLAEEHIQSIIRGVLLQAKQTSNNSLRLSTMRKEFRSLKLPDNAKPWKYILFTNASDSRDLGEAVSEGSSKAGFSEATVVSRSNLESFLNKAENQDLIPRFFPIHASSSGAENRVSRHSNWEPSSQIFSTILHDYFSDKRGKLIVEDIEYEGCYPNRCSPDLAPSEWFKACTMDINKDGLVFGDTVDGMLYLIPFEAMVLWDEWTRDKIEGLPHLFVAGLDRIKPLNRSYLNR
jgi:hypothetical protein